MLSVVSLERGSREKPERENTDKLSCTYKEILNLSSAQNDMSAGRGEDMQIRKVFFY